MPPETSDDDWDFGEPDQAAMAAASSDEAVLTAYVEALHTRLIDYVSRITKLAASKAPIDQQGIAIRSGRAGMSEFLCSRHWVDLMEWTPPFTDVRPLSKSERAILPVCANAPRCAGFDQHPQ